MGRILSWNHANRHAEKFSPGGDDSIIHMYSSGYLLEIIINNNHKSNNTTVQRQFCYVQW